MRIGLIRHFPVTEKFPSGWMTTADLRVWRERYEMATTTVGEFHIGDVPWRACLSSDLPRARITASAVFRGDIEHTDLLREAEFAEFRTGKLLLPVLGWRLLLQFAWMFGHSSQRVCRDDFRRRVRAMADRLEAKAEDTLVVSHAGMMAYLSAELRRRGFSGPKLRIAKYAQVYIYEKDSEPVPPKGLANIATVK